MGQVGRRGQERQEGRDGWRGRNGWWGRWAGGVVTLALYYLGRFGQLVGMWILLVDVFTAGRLGPSAKLFATGVAVFLAGWGLTKVIRKP